MQVVIDQWSQLFNELEQKISPNGSRQLMAALIADLYDISVLNFGTEGIARPSPWAPLSSLYALRKHDGDRTPRLILSDVMRNSFEVTASETSATLSNSAEYFELHQFGAGRIPARPMMPVTADGSNLTEYAKTKLLETLDSHFGVQPLSKFGAE